MAAIEGVRRLRQVGRYVTACSVAGATLLVFQFLDGNQIIGWWHLFLLFAIPLVAGALLKALAWVLEGFFLPLDTRN